MNSDTPAMMESTSFRFRRSNRDFTEGSLKGLCFADMEKRVVSGFANSRWKLSSKSEGGVKSPSEAVKVRGFASFREICVSAVSQTARERTVLRSISGLNGNKKATQMSCRKCDGGVYVTFPGFRFALEIRCNSPISRSKLSDLAFFTQEK